MRKILFIAAIPLLAGCSTQKSVIVKSREPIHREQALQGEISMQDYFYLLDAEKELNEMKGIKK